MKDRFYVECQLHCLWVFFITVKLLPLGQMSMASVGVKTMCVCEELLFPHGSCSSR